MKSMTYGELPSYTAFKNAFDTEVKSTFYDVRLSSSDSRASDGTLFGTGEYSAKELYKALKSLMVKYESGDSEEAQNAAGDLVGSVLYTLGFEWI